MFKIIKSNTYAEMLQQTQRLESRLTFAEAQLDNQRAIIDRSVMELTDTSKKLEEQTREFQSVTIAHDWEQWRAGYWKQKCLNRRSKLITRKKKKPKTKKRK